jgi:nitrate reductase gamma subunit
MRDQFLFAIAPRLAVLTCLLTAAVRYGRNRRAGEPAETTTRWHEPAEDLRAWWRYSIAVVILGHVLAVASPGVLLLWNRQALRLVGLESVGLIAGSIALVCVVATVLRRRRYMQSPVDVIAATLVVLELVSGLVLAVRYRWASSWSVVTLTPYLYSLVAPRASVVLLAHMPFVVKLHVFCAFAIIAATPLTVLAGVVMVALRDLARLMTTPVTLSWLPVWYARRVWAARARPPIGDGEM